MKYGQTFHAQSVPQWAAYNVDYDELKNLIKANTTKDQAQAIAIPGQEDPRLEKFETSFFNELSNQHDRVDLFVKSKADEISRRLQHLQKVVLRLLARTTRSSDSDPISQKHRDKFARYNVQIERCGDDIRSLQRFVSAQRVAFHKIIKKYKKWTGSRALGERFNDEVLSNPKSLVRRDFGPLLSQYQDLSINLQSSTPAGSEPPSLTSSRRPSRRPSTQIAVQQLPQHNWNEYDDGSEGGEDEPYHIYVNPDGDSFPGAKTVEYVFAKVKKPMESVKAWFSPSTSPGERHGLLVDRNDGYFAEQQSVVDTDLEDEAYASSNNEFPAGYMAHYATFPSINDQKFSRHREMLLFRGMVGAYAGSLMLIVITSILISTGRHKLRAEVDAGAIAGCIASLCFALAGITAALCRKQTLNWLHRACVGVTFAGLLFLNLMLLFLVLDNIRG
ncbi:SPX-domain-containing protein [Cadophora sp. DSE1049]|nr:SPX-domain-containing protein [Cadophora sp. DSE1049]